MGPEAAPGLRRELRLWDLVFLNVAAVASVRWMAAAAHAGPGSLTLWALAILGFFVPSAFVVASLSQRFPEEGGLYIWTKRAFGDWHGFLCAWLYFVSNLLFTPSLALAAVALSGYLWSAHPEQQGQNRVYTLTATCLLIWGAYLAHLFGLKIGKWTANIGGAATYSAAALLAVLAFWIVLQRGSVTKFELMPAPSWATVNLWSQIAFALVGLELGPILGGEIRDPRKNIPRAAWIGAGACALFYIAGTAAILAVRQPSEISEVSGLAQAGVSVGALLNAPLFPPLFAALIVAGTFGALASWVAGNTRLPYVIGVDRYLPPVFGKLHPRWGTPHVSILTQATASTLLLAATQAGETITAGYQILVDMTVITTFIPYVYIFATGWKFGQRLAAALGLAVSLLAILLSAAPPPEALSWPLFELKVVGGSVVLALLGRRLFIREGRNRR